MKFIYLIFSLFLSISLQAQILKVSKFEGEYKDDRFDLTFTSIREVETSYFMIEKSDNALDFKVIASIHCKGDNTNYNYVDSFQTKGCYYRLSEMNKKNQTEIHKIIFVEKKEKNVLRVFPNPSNGSDLNIESSKPYSIFDLFGRKCNEKELQSGMYIVHNGIKSVKLMIR